MQIAVSKFLKLYYIVHHDNIFYNLKSNCKAKNVYNMLILLIMLIYAKVTKKNLKVEQYHYLICCASYQ